MILKATTKAINEAAAHLKRGKLVAFPTETVYGLGADATNEQAVKAIFAAKNRPLNNPLIVHVRDLRTAKKFASFSQTALKLGKAYWPGPLTLVLPQRAESGLAKQVSGSGTTIALRIPQSKVARALLECCDFPIAAPSANRSGHVSPTRAQHVADDLGDNVALILDDGPCQWGLESTVIDVTSPNPIVLRSGAIATKTIEHMLGQSLSHEPQFPKNGELQQRSPGMLESHYAPKATLRLNARTVNKGEGLLAFGPKPLQHDGPIINLSQAADLTEAAANLYAAMRVLDQARIQTIAVMPIPDHGLGEAINDRLRRAAAPRHEYHANSR